MYEANMPRPEYPRPEYPRPQFVRDQWMNINGEWQFEIDYGNSEKDRELFKPMKNGGEAYVDFPDRQKYEGQPYFVSEYGGIWWNPEQKDDVSWGYGNRPSSKEEFIKRYEELTNILLSNPRICAFCYTQLYDVEQEVNGLYTYDRKPKFDDAVIKRINMRKAAIETV